MSILQKKRVSAAEAADILGVPRATISRIDRQGVIIRRYKIGHKTFVYDVESLEQFLLANEVRPTRPSMVSPVVRGRMPFPKGTVSLSGEPKQSLREFLQGKRKEWSEQDKTTSNENSRRRR